MKRIISVSLLMLLLAGCGEPKHIVIDQTESKYQTESNYDSSQSLSRVLDTYGDRQAETADKAADAMTEDVERSIVGESKDDGSNWSIMNILRHALGITA